MCWCRYPRVWFVSRVRGVESFPSNELRCKRPPRLGKSPLGTSRHSERHVLPYCVLVLRQRLVLRQEQEGGGNHVDRFQEPAIVPVSVCVCVAHGRWAYTDAIAAPRPRRDQCHRESHDLAHPDSHAAATKWTTHSSGGCYAGATLVACGRSPWRSSAFACVRWSATRQEAFWSRLTKTRSLGSCLPALRHFPRIVDAQELIKAV